jgi:hypothetical protein
MDGTTGKTAPEATVREAVGVFHDPASLNGAISDLTGAGVDRAEMSLLAQQGILDGQPAEAYRSTRQAADDPTTPRQAIYADTDVRQGRTLLTSMASVIAAFAASGAVVLTGGAALAALAAAVGAGGGIGAIGALVGKRAGDEQQKYLQDQMARGGIVLWVKITDPARESRVCRILERYAADNVHVHDMPTDAAIDKRGNR